MKTQLKLPTRTRDNRSAAPGFFGELNEPGSGLRVRQWLLPVSLGCRLAYDPKLCIAVLGVFLRSV